jgi:transposase-like protein
MEVLQDMTQREEMAGSWAEGARRAEGAQEPSPARLDPEVPEKPERRKFTAEYKIKILAEADACKTPSEVGALLRREGLYSSHLSRWRSRQRAGALGALAPRKRGPEPDPVVPFKKRINDLERDNERLRKKLTQAETIIDVQKKVSGLLGTAEKGNGED